MKKFVSVIIALALFVTPLPVFAQETSLNEKADVLMAMLLQYGATSVQYAMIDNGEIVLSGGADALTITSGNTDYESLIYGLGSVSKMYVSAAVMMLADEGLVDIDKPVTTYIPDFKMNDERYKSITPRMLLNHSSGLYGSTLNNAFLFDDNDTYARDNILTKLQNQDLKANPGEFSVYSNDSFTLLEVLVEYVSDMSYTAFLHEYITEPLGLNFTKSPQDDFDRKLLANIYQAGTQTPLPYDTVNIIGTGGLYSTAKELVIFSDVLMGNREDILSAEAAQTMMNEEYRNGIWVSESDNAIAYGLGWDSVKLTPFGDYDITALTKGGDSLFYHASLIALPEHDIAMAVISSGGMSTYNQLMAANILQEYLLEKEIIEEISPPKTFEPPIQEEIPEYLKKYAGHYASILASANIYLEEDEMVVLTNVNGVDVVQTFIYAGNELFKSDDGSITLSFEENSGRVYLKANVIANTPLGQSVAAYYEMQQLKANPLDETVSDAWAKRDGKVYYALNEKATSQLYLNSALFSRLSLDLENGYVFGGMRIVDQDNAVNALQIPISAGRDVSNMEFYVIDDIEYLAARAYILISEDYISSISATGKSICTIQQTGYARWFSIGEEVAGKTMTVEMPQNAEFAVYNADFICINSTAAGGQNTVTLPEKGVIVFAGTSGDVFEISLE